MFDKEQFIADCRTALQQDRGNRYVRDVVARAVSDPGAVIRELGEPTQAGLQVIHRADDLTILNVAWPANFVIMPHNHAMWAVIGVYTGREDNILWRRLPEDANSRIEAAGAKSLGEKDVLPLGADVIHSVVNPVKRVTGAIHVYGGDFFGVPRSEWEPETLVEMPYDMQKVLKMLNDRT
jgi:predicted metal-dependent enzyme (double-stranded beta helix superfamily)